MNEDHAGLRDLDTHALLNSWSLAIRLKRVRRQGWLDRGVENPESSADHSWGVALLAWMLARDRDDLDRERMLRLALLHDLPEAVAGDVTPFDDLRDRDGRIALDHLRSAPRYSHAAERAKREAEQAALEEILSGFPADIADELRSLWMEYERGETPEARFVRQIDKLETLLQAEDYLSRQPDLIIDSFRLGTRRDATDPALVRLLSALPEPPAE